MQALPLPLVAGAAAEAPGVDVVLAGVRLGRRRGESDGTDVGGMRRRRAFALLSCGTVLFVAAYLLLQEAAIRRAKAAGAPLSPAWLTLVNEGVYALLAACECALVGAGPRGDRRARGARLPKWRGAYGVLALVVFSAMWCTNASLAHVDFATRLVAKSAKVVPVMAISRALLGKRYSPAEYAAALVLAAGVALFSLGDAMVNPEWHITGMALLAAAVALDALTTTIAERYVFKSKAGAATHPEMIVWTSGLATVLASLSLCVDGTLASELACGVGSRGCASSGAGAHARATAQLVAASASGYLGLSCVLQLVKHFGATEAEIVKACRKVFSVGLSYACFGKPFAPPAALGLLLVLAALCATHHARRRRAARTARL